MCTADAQAVCAAQSASLSAHTQQIVLCAHVLLAEMCLVTAPSVDAKRTNRKLWRKRLARAEQCVRTFDQARAEQSAALPVRPCSRSYLRCTWQLPLSVNTSKQPTHALPTAVAVSLHSQLEWRCRLHKVQCLLLEASTTESHAKNQQMLELLCTATRESSDQASSVSFQPYFLSKLRAHLVALHAASLLAESSESAEPPHAPFLQSVQFVQQCLLDDCDSAFQVRLLPLYRVL